MNRLNRPYEILEMYALLFTDIFCLLFSYMFALWLRFSAIRNIDEAQLHWMVFLGVLIYTLFYHFAVNYSRNFIKRGHYVEFTMITKCNVIMAAGLGLILFAVKEAENYSRLVFGYFIVIDEVFTYIAHIAVKKYLCRHLKKERNMIKMMVITNKEYAEKLLDKLSKNGEIFWDITSVAMMDQKDTDLNETYVNCGNLKVPIVANRENLLEVSKQMPIDEVFIYLPKEDRMIIDHLIMDFETMGVICHYNIDVADLKSNHSILEELGGFTVITYAENQIDYKHRMIKRFMDIVGSIIGLAITAVIFPFVAVAIKLDSKGPVLFAQTRIGKNGRRFKIYKFRSMYIDAEKRKGELKKQNEVDGLMFKMQNDPRVTRVGKMLRKTSIDELPQFYNILIGDMSLVGTRPPTEDEFEQYTPYYRKRLSMTPGLTGLWQVSGRSNISNFDEVVKLDLQYIDYWSLSMDVKILFQTIIVVLFGKGAK